MSLDIRLDFINNIKPVAIQEMGELRKTFISIDTQLRAISDTLESMKKPAGQRTIALARTNLEIALQYAIKSLCIMGEDE